MRIFAFVVALFLSVGLFGQEESMLARQYFQDGEFEKAATLYHKLYDKNQTNNFYFDRYIDCLLSLEDYDNCEKIIKKEIKKQEDNVNLYVTYGKLLERQIKDEEATQQYNKAISKLPKERYAIIKLANAFLVLTKFDLAIESYEKGARLLNNKYIFAFNLGDLYRRKGDTENMINSYLNSLEDNPGRLPHLKSTFQRYLLKDDYLVLQAQLYDRLQENEASIHYPELLSWVFIQRKDYKNAFRQAKALDRRLEETGGRIFRIGDIAANDGDYDAAIAAYEFIIEEKGIASTYYIDAKREALRCRRLKLVEGFSYTMEDLRVIESQYEFFLTEFGNNPATAGIAIELAELEALYLNDLDKAISLLSGITTMPGINKRTKAYAKLNLADFYLMQGERWEATLLYSQVDKAFKEDVLGHEARFRNAKLSYYSGDFQWAQSQFDILKASTSKLIANDALDLSVFIMDNLGLDSVATAMELYAATDLLIFQNRFEDAFLTLDTLIRQFPDHALEDDVWYLESKIYYKKREFVKCAEKLHAIVEKYPEGIRTDNALYELAEMYEGPLNDLEKAKALYETIFIDYSGSTFAVEARKKYRELRGDNVQ